MAELARMAKRLRVAEMYVADATLREIAAELELSHEQVRRILAEMHFEMRRRGPRSRDARGRDVTNT